MKLLTESDFVRAAETIGCSIPAIKAVCQVEAPAGGFDAAGMPRILFEGHTFSRLTGGIYDKSNPTVSYPRWVRTFYARGANADSRNTGEHARLAEAAALDRDAALQSASWGKFQIMGENYKVAGFASLQKFINAMYASEGAHLDAFVGYVMSTGLADELRDRKWAEFARRYNGPAYAENQYDVKMASAYNQLVAT